MKFITKNIRKLAIIGVLILLFILIPIFFVLKNKNQTSIEKNFLSRTDYRIFACGEEIFLKVDSESLKVKRNGLFARSELGSIIADGTPSNIDDVLLTSFFDAAGGTLEYSDEHKDTLRIPTEAGFREFRSGDLCNGKKANLYVIRHRIETLTNPWSIHSRIVWKYFDYVLTNNYDEVSPKDCVIFIFDSEDALNRPWAHCVSHEEALASGKLILSR